MAEMSHPGWKDVGLTPGFVAILKGMGDFHALESLVYDRVVHHGRTLQYTYHCGVCGHVHRPKRVTDDYGQCGNNRCRSRAIRGVPSLKPMSRPHPPGSCMSDEFAQRVIEAMRANYDMYFEQKFQPQELIQFRWESSFRAQFLGGEETSAASMSVCITRAALLVPFVWDTRFDWSLRRRRGRPGPLVPALAELVETKKAKKK
jgi:hypothetical protein